MGNKSGVPVHASHALNQRSKERLYVFVTELSRRAALNYT